MTVKVAKTGQMLSPGLMFSKAGDLGISVHSFIVVCCQLLRSLVEFELDVLNSARERTPHRIQPDLLSKKVVFAPHARTRFAGGVHAARTGVILGL